MRYSLNGYNSSETNRSLLKILDDNSDVFREGILK